MLNPAFGHVETWLFDLDDTLYPHGHFMPREEFHALYHAYAAEQNGIAIEEARRIAAEIKLAEPHSDFISAWQRRAKFDAEGFYRLIDSVELTRIRPCAVRRAKLERLPGRKIIFTNAHRSHAERLLRHLELEHHFDYVSDYEARERGVKPNPVIYDRLVAQLGIDPSRAAMVEDVAENLVPAHALGMTTILLHPAPEPELAEADYIDHHAPDIDSWLDRALA
jgi:putative hydrolase of the HAD superfamily